jgi:site-specific recombinase XerD
MYAAGLRVSEVINLKISNIDSSRMIINIRDAKGGFDRQVPLDPSLLELFRKYFMEYHPKEFLFNGQDSPQYSERSIQQFLQKYAKAAGITKHIHPHLLRHNCATHMVEDGTDINLIQKILGHKNVKTTNIYLHISDNHIRKIRTPLVGIKL